MVKLFQFQQAINHHHINFDLFPTHKLSLILIILYRFKFYLSKLNAKIVLSCGF